MNDPTRPLSPDVVDELLSADIDGEFERAASELGFTSDAARAALDATAGTTARRAALVRARDRLAAPLVPAPAQEHQLVASVLARHAGVPATPAPASRFRRRRFENGWRVLVAAGSAAAVIAAIVAVSAGRPGSEAKSSAPLASDGQSDSLATTPFAGAGGSIAFGDVTASDSLRTKVRSELRTLSKPSPAATANSGNSPGPTEAAKSGTTTTIPAPHFGTPSTLEPAPLPLTTPGAAACGAAAARLAHASAAPTLSGTGTYAGKPVAVVVFREGGAYTVYLLSGTDCSLVARESVP